MSASSDEEEGFHYARLDRATELYEQFGQVWADYLEQRPHRLTMDTDPDGFTRIRVERLTPVPLRLSLLLGEYLYELRAALDNCLYTVAAVDSEQSPPLNGELLEWPIYLTRKKWKDNQRRFAALSPTLRDALEDIQPYQAQSPGWNCLRILHDLARTDRHRALHLVTLHATYGNAMIDSTLIADFKGHTGVVGVDGVVATFRHLDPQRELTTENFDYNVEFEVEIAEVAEAPHPASGRASRPWGGLDKRLQALHKAVLEYVAGLEAMAKNIRAQREQE